MGSENICSACSWSPDRQSKCFYNSHVKLFYEASNRGAWSLGSKLILKERSADPPNFEVSNTAFLKSKTSIPLPDILDDWQEDDGAYFILARRMPGQPLSEAWSTMSTADRERVAKQTAEYLTQLRGLQSDKMQSLGGKPLYDAFLFQSGYGTGHGPLSSDDDLWAILEQALEKVPEDIRAKLRQRMPSAAPYTFTHGDLTNVNIMIEDGNVTGIIDWEAAGYFPVWWEFAHAAIGLGDEDAEWKALLREYLPDYTEGRLFWRAFWALSDYPDLDERGLTFVKECGLEMPTKA